MARAIIMLGIRCNYVVRTCRNVMLWIDQRLRRAQLLDALDAVDARTPAANGCAMQARQRYQRWCALESGRGVMALYQWSCAASADA